MIKVPEAILYRIIQQAKQENPLEACGYLGGKANEVKKIYPMTNVDRSPDHFSFDPAEQFKVMKEARDSGLDLIAVYHTHPATPSRMSVEDVRLAYDTSIFYLIYSLQANNLKAFKVNSEKQVFEVPVEVINEKKYR